jgi:hypothetical protein
MPTGVVKSFSQDPFAPVLFNSPALAVTDEQKGYVKKVLDKSCSDSQFSDKAYRAITLILTGGNAQVPVVTSLTPNSAEIGDADFVLHVHGTGFKNTDTIVFAGVDEPTTFVSTSELTTGVNMSVWVGPDALPVLVRNAEGVLSAPMTFTFVDNVALLSAPTTQTKYVEKVHPPTPTPAPVKK